MLPEQSRTMAIEPVPSPYRPDDLVAGPDRDAGAGVVGRGQADGGLIGHRVELDVGPRSKSWPRKNPVTRAGTETSRGRVSFAILLGIADHGLKTLKRSVVSPGAARVPRGSRLLLAVELESCASGAGLTTGRPGGIWSSLPSAAMR